MPFRHTILSTVIGGALLLGGSLVHAQGHWPEYRGPSADGHAPAGARLPLKWSESENVRWKVPIHDKGWSTPAAWGDQLWLTTALETGQAMFAVCVDVRDGQVLLDKKLFDVPNPDPLGNALNSYASCSPAIEAGRVYIHFGSYGTACLDTSTFQVLWEQRDLPCNHFRGPASSPVIFENLLIFHMDGSDHDYIVALDKLTGSPVWTTKRSTDYRDLDENGKPMADGDFRKAYGTPSLIEVDGRLLLVSPSAKAIYAYDPRTGEEIWQVQHDGHSVAPRSLYDGRRVYVTTGSGSTYALAIDPRGQGNITGSNIVWKTDKQVPKRSSPVLVEGLIYSCTDTGIASCVDANTGDVLWQQRLGGDYSASILYGSGRLYFFDQDGASFVIGPGRAFQELARNRLDDGCMASPICVGNSLIVRTKTHLYRIEQH